MDERYYHSIEFHSEKCDLSLNCIRVCPTQAIRVKKNGLEFIEERCIDCGECVKVCPNNAIIAKTNDLSEFSHFKHLVAIPSPTLYTQFGKEVNPYQILTALKHIGFDDVYPLTWTCEAVYTAIKEFVKDYKGNFPFISSSCPVIVRLLQVLYPEMLKQLIPIDVPKEIAAKKMREEKSRSLGIRPEDIGAIYITPCPAKMISIKQPAEKIKSYLDGAISINDIYNQLYAQIVRLKKDEDFKTKSEKISNTRRMLGPITKQSLYWSVLGGDKNTKDRVGWLTASGLDNVIRIFDDLEKGKLRNVKYLQLLACRDGCIGGTLTVENLYIARATAIHLIEELPKLFESKQKEYIEMYKQGLFNFEGKVLPRKLDKSGNIIEAIKKKKEKDEIYKQLPNIDCGICGAPTCLSFAEDIVNGFSELMDCIFFAEDNFDEIKKRFINRKKKQ